MNGGTRLGISVVDGGGARWFGDARMPLYGWLHAAQGRPRDLGVVLCAAFGREELSSHRTMRRLADQLAAAGFAVLRFDYPGTGDSAGDADTPALVPAWIASIGTAADALRRASGVGRVALVGLRLGALLAVQAAMTRDDVAGLVAIAPPASGRVFAREARLLGGARAGAEGAPLETGGFVLAAQTCTDLSSLQPATGDRAPAPQVLLIDRDDLPPSTKLAQAWRQRGAEVECREATDFAQLMLDPEHAKVPEGLLADVTAWLRALAGDASPREVVKASAGIGTDRAQADIAPGVRERIVTVTGDGIAMAGVLSMPAQGECRGALVLPNAGATRRIGPGRLHVELARRLAARGWCVLRVDLRGLGDTPAAAGVAEHQVYARDGVADMACAVHWLRAQSPTLRVEAVGLCSGAYHAYKVAAERGGPDGFIAVNPLAFSWNYDQTSGVPLDKAIGEMKRYREVLSSPGAWIKLLRGRVDIRHLSSVLRTRASIALRRMGRPMDRALGRSDGGDVPGALRTMATAGITPRFVFAAGDPGDTLLAELGGGTLRRLTQVGAVTIARIDGADHTFTWQAERQALFACIETLLEAGSGRATGAGPRIEAPARAA